MSKVWITIEQDDDGHLVVKDGSGEVITKAERTKPSYVQHAAQKWADDLVSDVRRIAPHAMRLLTNKNPQAAKF